MGLLESLGAGVKAVATSLAPQTSTPFSNWGAGLFGSSSVSGYVSTSPVSDTPYAASPGSRDSYTNDVGDVSLNGVVSAAVSAIAEAFCSAPLLLEQRKGDKWNRVEMHPCIELLHNPNPFYGSDQMWEAEIAGELFTGSGFLRAVWNEARTQPVELWHEPAIAPVFDARQFIASYLAWVDGRAFPLGAAALYGDKGDPLANRRVDSAIHFRYRLNRRNPRFGESPLLPVLREIAGDNVAATFQTALLRNGAGASFFVTAKEGQQVTPKQMEEILSSAERRLTREGAGRIAGSNLPVDFHKVSFSPDELALDKLPAHYEARICAALKVPPMILGLSAGESTKTYSNLGEAIDDFWQRTIIPMQERKGAELEAQLLRLFDMDAREWRFGFDRSQIAALQDDEQSLYGRLTQAVGAGWMTPNEARGRARLPVVPGADILVGSPPASSPEPSETKSWNEAEHPRDEHGRWGNRVIMELGDRAKEGLPEAAYIMTPSGETLFYNEATNDDPDKVDLHDATFAEANEVHFYHSHPYESPPSDADWRAFLVSKNATKSVIVTPNAIYTLRKPKDYTGGQYKLEQSGMILLALKKQVQAERGYASVKDKAIPRGDLIQIWDEANVRTAKSYNILLEKMEVA